MTVSMTAAEVVDAVQLAAGIGAFLGVVVLGLLVYLLVRPSRKAPPPKREPDALDVEEMLGLLERMAQRLEVLERAVGEDDKDKAPLTGGRRQQQLLEADEQRPQAGRTE